MTDPPALALPLALTMGDPAGIGAEIALAAWASGRVAQPFFLIGDPARLAEGLLQELRRDALIEMR